MYRGLACHNSKNSLSVATLKHLSKLVLSLTNSRMLLSFTSNQGSWMSRVAEQLLLQDNGEGPYSGIQHASAWRFKQYSSISRQFFQQTLPSSSAWCPTRPLLPVVDPVYGQDLAQHLSPPLSHFYPTMEKWPMNIHEPSYRGQFWT